MHLTYRPVPTDGALRQLEDYDWPGNVRELQNVIERSLILSRGAPLSFPDLGERRIPAKTPPAQEPEKIVSLDEAVIRHIRLALKQTKGKLAGKGGAAELLNINPSTLRAKIRKYKISDR